MQLIFVQGSITEIMITHPYLAIASNVSLVIGGSASKLPPFMLIVDLF